MRFLVVTPARNEAHHLPALAASLRGQDPSVIAGWVIVDDASTDGTATAVDPMSMPFDTVVVSRGHGDQGLARGGAFQAFIAGARAGLLRHPDADRVMKLDADIVLDDSYMRRVAEVPASVALVGGVLEGASDREQRHHVRGALKAYNRWAFELVGTLPAAVGHDVMDEVAIRDAGGEVVVVTEARGRSQRRTGTSEGALAGRVRNGRVTRWTGYHPAYFALRLVRYAFRRPYGIGAAAMLAGYLRAGSGPYPAELRAAHRRQQAARLRELRAHPLRYLREAFV